jgi:uncharacterized membrane protein
MIFGAISVDIGSRLGIGTFFEITDVGSVVSSIMVAALIIASILFVLYFVWSAFRWLTAGGDKTQIEIARQRMTNAFVGLILTAAIWAVFLIVIYILGLPVNTG